MEHHSTLAPNIFHTASHFGNKAWWPRSRTTRSSCIHGCYNDDILLPQPPPPCSPSPHYHPTSSAYVSSGTCFYWLYLGRCHRRLALLLTRLLSVLPNASLLGDLGIVVNVSVVVNHVQFIDVVARFVCGRTMISNVSGKRKLPG